MAVLIFAALASLAMPGCDSADPIDGFDLRDLDPQIQPWDEVICTVGTSDRCYAHTPSGDKLWASVVSWCDLKARVDSGEYINPSAGWEQWECSYQTVPTSFDDFLCYLTNAAETVCYGGSGGWYTMVEPSCIATEFTDPAWPAGTCNYSPDTGPHDYDSISVVPGGVMTHGRAIIGPDAFYVIPECKISAGGLPAADPYSC